MRRLATFICCVALAACCAAGAAGCAQQDGLKLGTGNEEGMYYQFGTALADAAAGSAEAPALSVETTAGSSANLRLLSQGFLDAATVQADTLHDAANGTGLFADSGAYEGYSAVAGLYTEACQIVVPADSAITSVADLAGKTVSLGERESGVLQNALQILDAYNLTEGDFTAEHLSFSDSAAALQSGAIDAAFITAAAPTPAVTGLADAIGVRVLGLDAYAIDALTAHYSYYMPCSIPAGTYQGQSETVDTVGVRAVLVARNDVPDDQVRALLDLLFADSAALAQLPGDMRPALQQATDGIPVPFHPAAAAFFADNGLTVETAQGQSGAGVSASQDD